MLTSIWSGLIDPREAVVERNKGVAFLATACEIYHLSSLFYFCINIPQDVSGLLVHCAFSNSFASQAITRTPIASDRLAQVAFFQNSEVVHDTVAEDAAGEKSASHQKLIRLPSRKREIGYLGFALDPNSSDVDADTRTYLSTELKILGTYFHNHMLRRHGSDTAEDLLVSARELDCLKWAAAGKSAWEASVILGISERTVRFHLNSAREKLNCATTTQAVAKVVSQQLISI